MVLISKMAFLISKILFVRRTACPPGSFGINCTLSCPVNYYGFHCKSPCNCYIDEICLQETGCAKISGFSNQTVSNNYGIRTKGNTVLVSVMCTLIALLIVIILVVFVIKRFNLCADRFKRIRQICPDQDNMGNDPHHGRNGLPSINGLVSMNPNFSHQCTLAMEDSLYEDFDNGVSNEYNVLELRQRNISCVSSDLDRMGNQDEYVSLRHEGSMQKYDVQENS